MAVVDLIDKVNSPLSSGGASLSRTSQNVYLSGTSYHRFDKDQTINYSLSYNESTKTISVTISCGWTGYGFTPVTTSYTTIINLE